MDITLKDQLICVIGKSVNCEAGLKALLTVVIINNNCKKILNMIYKTKDLHFHDRETLILSSQLAKYTCRPSIQIVNQLLIMTGMWSSSHFI